MDILMTHYKIQDYGGIINYSEQLARGFKELGFNVASVMLKNTGASQPAKAPDPTLSPGDDWDFGEGLGLWMHQQKGWKGMAEVNYKKDIGRYFAFVENTDLVIHVIPVPTCTKQNVGDLDWLKVYDHGNTQIAVVHDGNLPRLYPHMLRIAALLDGVVCVHDAAYNTAAELPVRRQLIPNPHDISRPNKTPASERNHGLLSLQTFKRWKRVDDLIRAIPHMDEFSEKTICGGGIEQRYMTSKDKCKAEYKNDKGEKIWDVAIEHGMEYLGFVNNPTRDRLLGENRLLVDPSWSVNYSQYGAMFNRVFVEAMIQGCVPVVNDLAMQDPMLFEKGHNFLAVPHDSTPFYYGELLEEYLNHPSMLGRIQENNWEEIKSHDRKYIAESIWNFAFEDDGKVGKPSERFIKDCDRKMEHFDDL